MPGAFGVVCAGVHKVTGELVAVKQIPRRLTQPTKLQSEVDLLRLAGQHSNVVNFRDLFSDEDYFYIVMGECEHVSPLIERTDEVEVTIGLVLGINMLLQIANQSPQSCFYSKCTEKRGARKNAHGRVRAEEPLIVCLLIA